MSTARPLPPEAKTLIRLHSAWILAASLVIIVFGVLAFVGDEAVIGIVCLTVAVLLAVFWWRWSTLVYRAYRWELDAEAVQLWSGVIVTSRSVLPRARVQNVTRTAGPVQRLAGVATVVVHSAGAHTPDIVLPHLLADDADAVRRTLLPAESDLFPDSVASSDEPAVLAGDDAG